MKGILTAEDAIMAVEHGVSGIIVSNHGGRQIDTAPASVSDISKIQISLAKQGDLICQIITYFKNHRLKHFPI